MVMTINIDNLHILYLGCYRFENKTFMLYLDDVTYRKNNCSHHFFAPIFSDNTVCRIKWSESTILYGATKWKMVSSNISQQLLAIEYKSHDIKTLKVRREHL